MNIGPRLDLRQTQSLVMTPQLQQAIRLLTASNLELETFIGDALETNPLLEAGAVTRDDSGGDSGDDPPQSTDGGADTLMAAGAGESDSPLDLNPETLDRDRDTGDGDIGAARDATLSQSAQTTEWGSAMPGDGGGGAGGGDAQFDLLANRADETTLAEHLDRQVGTYAINPREAFAARHIVGLLDEAGYLSTGLYEIADDLGLSIDEAEDALTVVQMCDPTGVGARDLAECLALQAREADRFDPCMQALIDNLDLIEKGDVARLKRVCKVDDDDFADMLRELRGYDPRPGLAFSSALADPVIPDVLLQDDGAGGWNISLNQSTLPRLIVNRDYYLELDSGSRDRETKGWLKEKLADAHWLIRALDQRQKTILKTAGEIVKQQDGFFRRGVTHLRPLTLRDVAEKIDMHESTVSRVTSGKYLSCERGCFELKYFFSSGVASSDGEGASAEAIKARIRALIADETAKAILSDQKLADLLRDEGYDLARRTVAKYREAIGIGSSAQRRRQKKLEGL